MDESGSALTKLAIGRNYAPPDGDWEKHGEMIGRNTQLQELSIYRHESMAVADLETFFRGVSANRSIKRLCFFKCAYGEIARVLIPFFKNNNNLESLYIWGYWEDGLDPETDQASKLAIALEGFDSLKEFVMLGRLAGEKTKIFQALSRHSLESLSLIRMSIEGTECTALSNLIQKPNSNLASIDLAVGRIDSKLAKALAAGMKQVKDLELFGSDTPEASWRAIFWGLQSPSCRLEMLKLASNYFDDATTFSLAYALRNNRSLKLLDLGSQPRVTADGWGAIFQFLHSPNCELATLRLSDNRISDETILLLTNAIHINGRLRELDLGSISGVSDVGWETFFTLLHDPDSALEKLNLWGRNWFNDKPYLSGIALSFLMNSLANNTMLRELHVRIEDCVTHDGGNAFLQALNNTSNIMATYRSNHTLQAICEVKQENELPEDLVELLHLNREANKRQVARLKIIHTHFTGSNINLQPFMDMDMKVIPFAISWMGRDGIDSVWDNEGFDLLYQFSRNVLAGLFH